MLVEWSARVLEVFATVEPVDGRLTSMSMIVAFLAEEGGHEAQPMPPLSYGLMALVFFALLLGVTWAFRNNHQKSTPPEGDGHGHGAVGHGGHPGQVEGHH